MVLFIGRKTLVDFCLSLTFSLRVFLNFVELQLLCFSHLLVFIAKSRHSHKYLCRKPRIHCPFLVQQPLFFSFHEPLTLWFHFIHASVDFLQVHLSWVARRNYRYTNNLQYFTKNILFCREQDAFQVHPPWTSLRAVVSVILPWPWILPNVDLFFTLPTTTQISDQAVLWLSLL